MRSFFKSELETLKAKTGLNQYENMSAMPDAKNQFKVLFDSLELVCAKFPMIPDEAKKCIIRDRMITDENFNNLNSKVVWRWLESQRIYYMTHEEKKEEFGQIVFPELSEETKKKIDNYLNELRDFTPKISGVEDEMKKIVKEDNQRVTEKKGTQDTRPAFNVDLIDDDGNLVGTVENVRATSQEKANEAVVTAIRQGDLKI